MLQKYFSQNYKYKKFYYVGYSKLIKPCYKFLDFYDNGVVLIS